ncbi:MAG: hypothetical protein ABI432_15930 [Flavobacteriales bacterium]
MTAYLPFRNSILSVVLAGCTQLGLAQNNYLFEQVPPGNQAYEDLLGDTEITDFDLNGSFTLQAMAGETIRIFDTEYTLGAGTKLSISTDGFVRVDDENTMAVLDGAFTDLYPFDASSRYSYRLFGNTGNHILAVQYKNLRMSTGLAGNSMNMQIWYYQNTGMIEVRYGPRTENLANGFTLDRGPKIGIYSSPVDMSGCLEKVWLSGSPLLPEVSYEANYNFPGLNGVPPEGTIYRYVPTFTISISENTTSAHGRIRNDPATDRLFVTMPEASRSMLLVQDMAGRTLQTQLATTGENEIDISGLASGTYLLAEEDHGIRHAQRFVKQ